METVTVLVVDDHQVVREGIRGMLSTDNGIRVVGEAATGREALEVARKLRPRVVLMDIQMPDMDGLTATRTVKEELPTISVLMFTVHDDPNYLFEAVKCGAAGYVLKDSSRDELIQAIYTVAGGGSLLDPSLTSQLLRRLASEVKPSSAAGAPVERLTRREMEVLQLVAQGLTNKEIADRLVVSVETVKTHITHIMDKLEASDRTQAAVRAVALGLLR